MADSREQALEQALKSIEKDFGKGSIMRLGDKVKDKYEVIPTGSYALDKALNNSEQIIYFVKEENAALVKEIINNELKVHEGKIFLVNLDTMTIGNNNLVLRALRSDEPLMTIRNYKGKIEEFTSKDFIFFNSLVKQHA